MTGSHGDIGPELRQLAQLILDRLDPAVRAAAALAAGSGEGPCQQVWCPVCALVALINGEQHPLLDTLGEHSVALLAIVRAMLKVDDPGAPAAAPSPPPPDRPTGPPQAPAAEPAGAEDASRATNGRYQPITVILQESTDD